MIKKGRRTVRRLVALALAGLVAANPAWSQGAKLEKPQITIAAASLGITYLPMIVATHEGYFKEEGLNVEIAGFPGGSKALEALLGGSADVVAGAYSNTLTMAAKGQKLTVFAAQVDCPGWVLGVSTRKAGSFKSLADLKGFNIGVSAPGSSTHMALNYILTKSGVKTDEVQVIGVGTSAGAVAAMKAGQIDAMINNDPVMSILISGGDMKLEAEMRNREASAQVFGGPYPESSLYSLTDFIKKNPNTVQALANGIVRAEHFIAKATPDELAAAIPQEYLLGDKDLYKKSFQGSRGCISQTGLITAEGAAKVLEVLSAFEPNVRAAKIDMAATYDNSFAEKAAKTYP
jgi:NitT/TauT family transport system substrate-binding protein